MATVIVFGPTGAVGSLAARTAFEHGATVWLAMRDPNKAIPALERGFTAAGRLQADLMQPETVSKAVKDSGAKRAFIYLAHSAQDHMKGTLEALKSAGIEFVVFLSSFTIHTNEALRDVAPTELIPYVHAQVEANLDDVFGDDHYVAIRPGAFASNLQSQRVQDGKLQLYGGDFEQDNISPSDIGRVSGVVLATGPKNGQKKVYVYGPEILSIRDSIVKIGKTLGKDLNITSLSPEEGYNNYIAVGMPKVFAEYMVRVLSTKGPDKGSGERFPKYDEGVKNVELYTGKKSTALEDWVKENSTVFSAW